MKLHPRQHPPLVRSFFGRSLQMLRHAHTLDSSSGFSTDGLLSTARDFNNNVTKNKSVNHLFLNGLRWLAWFAGMAIAIMYLLWFFKNIFEISVR